MADINYNQIVSLIWNIADDVLRDVFLRGQYRDVILPMVVLRRLDALLEPTKDEVLKELEQLGPNDEIDEGVMRDITKLSYYNTSKWTLNRIKNQASGNNDLLCKNFVEYLNGFSENVGDVLKNFDFLNKARKLADNDRLLAIIQKITDTRINLTNTLQYDPDGLPLPALDNVGMGTVLIAFSGEKELGGKKYTETTMNGFSDNKTADKFDEEDDNRILVVANKYLTGFDQSKLCAMYIDKPLVDVLAVQSLSRLNRSASELGKKSEDLFILDFYNTTEDMKKSFEPYYTATALSGYTDVNVLYELKSFLLSIGVFTMEEVVLFSDLFIKGVPADEWSPIIDTCAQRFNEEIKFEGNGKADFKMKCKQFVKIYSRTSAILEYEVVEWERLFWFFRVLIPELKVKESEDDDLKDLLNSIDLNTYGTRRTALNQHIELDPGESTIDPLSPNMVNAGGEDGRLDPLDKIVKDFNERWFKGWKADPQEQKSKLIHLMRHVESDDDYVSLVKDNSDKVAADDVMNQILARYVRAMRKGDKSFYDEYKGNDSFRYGLLQAVKGFIANRKYANI